MKVVKNHLRNRRCSFASLMRIFNGALLVSSLLFFGACENEFDKYYEEPNWIESNAYDVLQGEGRFSNYLQLVDKTLYAKQLKGAGSYTFFAPNDDAFAAWLSEKGYASVADVPADVASDIVSYTMVYNQYEALHLGDLWSGGTWEGNIGLTYRKQTPSYKTLYKELRPGDSDSIYVYEGFQSTFNQDMFDHRYLHIYTDAYFRANGLVQTDYETVYPGSAWSPEVGNVHGASIVTGNIYACNGVVHELNQVVEMPKTLDEMIVQYGEDDSRSTEGWSTLKEMLYNKFADGSYQFMQYTENPQAALYFQKMYPEKEAELGSVYARNYDVANLMIAPNFNEYVTTGDATERTEGSGYTLFLPKKDVFKNYIENDVLKYTKNKSFNELSEQVIQTVIRSHMSRTMVWPSGFATAKNVARDINGEFINGIGRSGIGFGEFGVDLNNIEVASNALVYHIDHVIKSGLFESVYGRILLDPSFSYTQLLLATSSLYTKLTENTPYANGLNTTNYTGVDERYQYALLLAPDQLLKDDGFTYDVLNTTFKNEEINSGASIQAPERINRLVNSGVFIREISPEDDAYPEKVDFFNQPAALAGDYDGWGFLVNYYGELVRYKNGQLQAYGNIKDGTVANVTLDNEKSYVNGAVYTIDRLLNYSPRETQTAEVTGWEQPILEDAITEYLRAHSDCSLFKKYWDATYVKEQLRNYLSSSAHYTILVPTDTFMQEAINLGYIPTVASITPITNSDGTQTAPDVNKVVAAANFLLGHMLEGGVYVDDGMERVYEAEAHYTSSSSTTSIRLTEGSLDLVNAKTYVKISKDKANGNRLKFTARDLEYGQSTPVIGIASQKGTNTVVRHIDDSNIPARLSVIHKFDGFLHFKLNKVEEETPAEGEESGNE